MGKKKDSPPDMGNVVESIYSGIENEKKAKPAPLKPRRQTEIESIDQINVPADDVETPPIPLKRQQRLKRP